MSNKPVTVVAIDGPAASGKSTVARATAQALGWVYVDSGALYRGVTWKALRENVDTRKPADVAALLPQFAWEFFDDHRAIRFTIAGEDPGQQLRSELVREAVSDIATVPEVRAFIVGELRKMTEFGPLVMEGRDIGSVVFPDTPFKFYLDANPVERARRRAAELAQAEGRGDLDQVLSSLTRRDQKDSGRKTAPLQIPLGARVIDSTQLQVADVVALILGELRRAGVAP
jgi:cytidylate kinase